MGKTIAYFQNYCAQNAQEPMQAFQAGVQKYNYKFVPDDLNADIAVIWSVLWAGRMQGNKKIFDTFRSANKPVIVIDVGTIKRNVTWKIAVNHINALGHYGNTDNLDLGRIDKLGLRLGTQVENNGKILIAAQHRQSLQLADHNLESWINGQIKSIKKRTDRKIVVRSHPRCPLNYASLIGVDEFDTPRKLNGTYDDFNFNLNYHTVVNYSSGPGIQAAIAGVRPIVSPASLAYPVAIQHENIEKLYDIDRENWLHQLAHTEWTVDEMRDGKYFERLLPYL